MTKKLLTKHCALMLLVAFAAAWSTTAWADVTINVKAPSAPHVYVWNSSQTPLNGEWPGEIVTNTKVVNGETYYTKTFNENTVSVIFAKNNTDSVLIKCLSVVSFTIYNFSVSNDITRPFSI